MCVWVCAFDFPHVDRMLQNAVEGPAVKVLQAALTHVHDPDNMEDGDNRSTYEVSACIHIGMHEVARITLLNVTIV